MSTEVTRREVIRATASELFSQKGYAGTTMQDISAEAGVLPGSLYHHFPSKSAIAVSLLTNFRTDLLKLVDEFRASVPENLPPVERLRALATAVAETSFQHVGAVRLRAYEAAGGDDSELNKALGLRAQPLDVLWTEVVAGLLHGPHNPRLDAGLLCFALRSLTLEAGLGHHQAQDPAGFAEDLCRLLLDGVLSARPDDRELTDSPAHAAVIDSVRAWPTRDLDDPRERALLAARDQFALRGYEATTIRDIARASGLAMATLYRRVESKDAMLQEILETYAETVRGGYEAALTTPGVTVPQALDALCLFFSYMVRGWHKEHTVARLGWSHRDNLSIHRFYLSTQRHMSLIEEVLRRGQAMGEVSRRLDAADMAPLLRTVLSVPSHRHERSGRPRVARFLRESVLRGSLAH
ncbi:helix-turn-helix domain-containing protein [Streptomyces sp. NPDC048106]|uniref:TetR/AcrR family transcriptional regulator n=1 Tax=Streptomyces sp. NPDC048106 TaxID=3155750 RepID=UPI003454D3CB